MKIDDKVIQLKKDFDIEFVMSEINMKANRETVENDFRITGDRLETMDSNVICIA